PNAIKNFERNSFRDGVGSGTEQFSNLLNGIYFIENSDVFIMQYFDSIFYTDDKKVKITQNSHFPSQHYAHIAIDVKGREKFTIFFRLPHWSKQTTIFLNGHKVEIHEGVRLVPIFRN